MDGFKDFEIANAREWETESTLTVSTSGPPPPPAVSNQSAVPQDPPVHSQHAVPFAGVGGRNPAAQARPTAVQPGQNGYQTGTSSSSSTEILISNVREYAAAQTNRYTNGRNFNSNPDHNRQFPQQDRRVRENSSNPREGRQPLSSRSDRVEKPRDKWARPEGLVTNRLKYDREYRAQEAAENRRYLNQPEEDEEFLATGYYLWPSKEETPMDVLGHKLEELNTLRTAHKVYIHWNQRTRCLVIDSKATAHAESTIVAVIKGIRQAVQHKRAEDIMATPLYIVAPPTATAMRVVVQPKSIEQLERKEGDTPVKTVTGFELSGRGLTQEERLAWKSERVIMNQSNQDTLREALVKSMASLAPLKGWMRMRVHFGHLTLTSYKDDFAASKFGLEKFTEMMGNPRIIGQFDRKLANATVAMKTREKIVDWPGRFCPLESRIVDLKDVEFKHTEIIFVRMPDGADLRVEADVDKVLQSMKGQYQIGTIRLFKNDRRNKRADITMVDVESQVDWNLEIITDGSVPNMPAALQKLIEGSLPLKDTELVDALGLTYPAVSVYSPKDIVIDRVVVRSVAQYKTQDSGYVVEVAIYRRWDRSIRGDPVMESSVSMFHPNWDLEMESIENTTKERIWDRRLRNFFEPGLGRENGLEHFLLEVQNIQGFLSAANKDASLHGIPQPASTLGDSPKENTENMNGASAPKETEPENRSSSSSRS